MANDFHSLPDFDDSFLTELPAAYETSDLEDAAADLAALHQEELNAARVARAEAEALAQAPWNNTPWSPSAEELEGIDADANRAETPRGHTFRHSRGRPAGTIIVNRSRKVPVLAHILASGRAA